MYVKLPKAMLLLAVFASVSLFFACDGGIEAQTCDLTLPEAPCYDGDFSSSSDEIALSSSSDGSYDNLPQDNSSSSATSSSVEEEDSSSSDGDGEDAAVSSSSVTAVLSSSSARSSSSVRGSSSSVRASSSSVSASSSSTAGIVPFGCSRAGLTAAVDSYLAALEAGDHTLMTLTSAAKYSEYDNASKQDYRTGSVTPTVSKFGEGLWKKPRIVNFHRNLIDVADCATFTEVIINKDSKNANDPPYVIGVRLDVSGSQISEVRVLATSTEDWAFTATGYYNYSTKEDWSELPVSQHLTREQLKNDAEAYFKYFRNKDVEVPWGTQCARLEGGAYTGDRPGATCNIGVPNLNMDLPTIWWLADVDYGMVVLFVYFGGADSHLFRILPTGYRYIHTLTAMKQSDYQAP
ncbi:MAG: hypothetical protein LBQ76_00375 [Candidatus Fibromonas sp.]|nr:hypothetical protein [Candidatus Fibromonas sp.]